MHFASDNAGPVHPRVMEALAAANEGNALAYGSDGLTAGAKERIRDVFEAPRAEVFLAASGTAANAILLASLTRPWGTVFAAETAHIHEDECGATRVHDGGREDPRLSAENTASSTSGSCDASPGLGGGAFTGVASGPSRSRTSPSWGTLYTAPRDRRHRPPRSPARRVPLPHGTRAFFAKRRRGPRLHSARRFTWQAGGRSASSLGRGRKKRLVLPHEALRASSTAPLREVGQPPPWAGHLLSEDTAFRLGPSSSAWFRRLATCDSTSPARGQRRCAPLARALARAPEIAIDINRGQHASFYRHARATSFATLHRPRSRSTHLFGRAPARRADDDDDSPHRASRCGWSTTTPRSTLPSTSF